ncbi:hypothetical protein N7499_000806 [Penicillium canescens]|uniref:Uncharacterized protein n=1 Tax=Penicillium canescens TaxID=5083 RepID=A0AAD6IHI5_PENCN|nr:uncharacterized protein N7446_010989 [Penicillium canescens]KAJ6029659.1 hypothetical protein N7444_012646 [Penicillium canescens]KAJ6048091.1 hypothetical protein N7460_004238 [Penicillium canescens]KAJ6048306.1 hypothetical protein N7446_010989 [Penicillium canescens]KAJ6101176.1 hypothetical protein N7499_000806 [Penicillium canescens]KAJ6173634.1 hypothetical protein N7485_006446 [Penicillium canescens]
MSFLSEDHAQGRPRDGDWYLIESAGKVRRGRVAERCVEGVSSGRQRRRESRRNLRAGREEVEMKSSSQEPIPVNWTSMRMDEAPGRADEREVLKEEAGAE